MCSIAASFGAPVTDPPGNVARRSSAVPTPGRRRALDVETRCATPAIGAPRGTCYAHGSGDADAAQVVSLEVDDHHVLGPVLAAGGDRLGRVGRPRALDRHRPHPVAARPQEELGRRRDDRPAVAVHRGRELGAQRSERPLDARRVARERRPQVLDEVHLVDVAAPDRGPRLGDRRARAATATTSAPTPPPCTSQQRGQTPMLHPARADPAGGGGERARLRRARRRPGRSRGRGRRRVRGAAARKSSMRSKASAGRRVEHEPAAVAVTVGRAVPMPYRRAGERPRAAAGSRLRLQRHHLRRRAPARRALRRDLRRDRDRGLARALLRRVRGLLRPRDRRARAARSHGRHDPALAEQLLARRTALYLERAASGETVHAGRRGMRARDRRPRAGRRRVGRGRRRGGGRARRLRPARPLRRDRRGRGRRAGEARPAGATRRRSGGSASEPAGTLAFEDTHLGVEAAVAAGMRCVGVGDHGRRRAAQAAGAEAVVASLDWSIPTVRGLFA